MARPKKEMPPSKDHQLTIRFTEEMYDVLTRDAEASGLARTEYIRQLISNRHPVVKHEIVFNDKRILKVFRDIGRIGGNLNQIAAYMNSGGNMTNPMWKEIKDCISEIYEIRDAVRKVVGEYRGNY